MNNYDYIILGAGAAGLMLAREMADDPWFHSKSVLIIDRERRTDNDRTWCFWEKGNGEYDSILHRQWSNIYFNSSREDKRLSIAPYAYKMLRGADFYSYQWEALEKARHINITIAEVSSISEEEEGVVVNTSEGDFRATYIFSSFFDIESIRQQKKYPVLRQHFIGWYIKTEKPIFDSDAATFMDFSVEQSGNTRFMYVLPSSDREALVEYTLFSEDLLADIEYEDAIRTYLHDKLGVENYEIQEKEKGQIPMSCFDFEAANSDRILHIGLAGGWAKASTGFTFRNARRNTKKLVAHLKEHKKLKSFSIKNRYRQYDVLLLDILEENNALGSKIFDSLFEKRKPDLILKFLDEQTNYLEDLMVMTGCPTLPFTKALLKRIFSRR